MFSLCMCVHDGLCFQYTVLGNHKSVPQTTTSYATKQTVCTFISGHLSDALIGVQCGCAPKVCVDMHGAMVLLVV